MNPGMQRSMNGFHPNNNNIASTSSYRDLPPLHLSTPDYRNTTNAVHHQAHDVHSPHNVNVHPLQHNGWQSPLPPSTGHGQQFSQNQSMSQVAWADQMQQQAFNNTRGMPAYNMSFLPHQVLQDAFAMSSPVEAADEMTLVMTLLSSRKKGESYKDALNSLHGKNGHSASLWKDYYLDHKDKLDVWIASLAAPKNIPFADDKQRHKERMSIANSLSHEQRPSIKKPSPSSFKPEDSPRASSVSSTTAPARKRKQSSQTYSPTLVPSITNSRRSTINSLTAPAPVYGSRLPAPNAEIRIPPVPASSPPVPTNIIPHRGRGNKYTEEDREFFINFISWRLQQDPDLTRLDLCEMLAEKAPHHSVQSWASHWSNNHDIPDKILAAARGEEYISGDESHSEEMISQRRPKYRESSTEDDSEQDGEGSINSQFEGEEEKGDDNSPVKRYTVSEMGQKGEPFTEADLYMTAKHIAAFPKFEEASSKDRWDSFCGKYPQRSAKSWAEYYRRNDQAINALVHKIRKQSMPTSTISQCVRTSQVSSKVKRKHDNHNTSDDISNPNKRGKGQDYIS